MVGKHALKNALIPVVTLAGMNLVIMISAAVAIETVFSWPGLGYHLYMAASNRDFNVVQGVVLVLAGLFVLVNLAIDLLYPLLDPRIRLEGKGVCFKKFFRRLIHHNGNVWTLLCRCFY